MKHGHSFAIALLALALAACGGGGGNGSDNTDTEVLGLTSEPRIEAVLGDFALDPGFPYQDLDNIQAGDSIQFQLVNYSGSGSSTSRNVLAVEDPSGNGGFSTTDQNGRIGQLSPTLGTFRAAAAITGSPRFIVGARFGGRTYTAFYRVRPRQIRLRGKVLAQGTGQPVYNARVDFYAPRDTGDPMSAVEIKATVRTGFDGTFRASIPAFNDNVDTVAEANAASQITFTVSRAELPDGFFPSFLFGGAFYDAGSNVCRPVLLSTNTVTDAATGETAFLPFQTGDRYLVTASDEINAPGVIQLVPTSAGTKPDATGCPVTEPPAEG